MRIYWWADPRASKKKSWLIAIYIGPPSWRRIGELSTQVYALGLHQEKKCAHAPTWLADTRRRVFCAAYNQDKSISTFLGRPIRVSKRHTDIILPFDLADNVVTGDKEALEAAIQVLDSDGWNTQGQWLRASWIVCSSSASNGLRGLIYYSVYVTYRFDSAKRYLSSHLSK